MMVDIDKVISVKGLVIRVTPIIPDMNKGMYTPPHIEPC